MAFFHALRSKSSDTPINTVLLLHFCFSIDTRDASLPKLLVHDAQKCTNTFLPLKSFRLMTFPLFVEQLNIGAGLPMASPER